MKTDYKDLPSLNDKKLRTLRNNLNNRIESLNRGDEKTLPPSHMLHGMDLKECNELKEKVFQEMKKRAKA